MKNVVSIAMSTEKKTYGHPVPVVISPLLKSAQINETMTGNKSPLLRS